MSIQGSRRCLKVVMLVLYGMYFAVLRYFIVPFGDDIFWWGPAGKYLMNHHFFTLKNPQYFGGSSNGRLVSNLTMIFSMHHPLVSFILFGFVSVLLVWLLYRIASRKIIVFWFALLLPFTLSKAFLAMTWFWYAAFINYVLGAVFILGYILILKLDLFDQQKLNYRVLSISSFFIALAGGLIVEHVTVYQIFLGLVGILEAYVVSQKVRPYQLTYLLGAILSAMIMFSNPVYHMKTPYRKVTFSWQAVWSTYVNSSHFWIITLNSFVLILLCSLILIVLWQKVIKTLPDYLAAITDVLFLGYFLAMKFYFSTKPLLPNFIPNITLSKTKLVDAVVSILFILFLLGVSFVITSNRKIRVMLMFSVVSFLVLIAPFIVITQPNAAREFFVGVLFLYLYSFILLDQVRIDFSAFKVTLSAATAICLLFSAVVVLHCNYQNHCYYEQRMSENVAVGAVPLKDRVPHPLYLPNQDLYVPSDSIAYWHDYRKIPFQKFIWKFDY